MPKDDDGYKEGVDFKWVTNPNTNVKTRKFFTKAEKAEMAAGKKADTPTASTQGTKPKARPATTPKKDVISSARAAINRSGPTRPQARPSSGSPAPTATSVTAPEVTETKLPASGAGATLKGYTWEEYRAGNNLGRLRAGVPMGLNRREFAERAAAEAAPKPQTPARTRGQRGARGMAKGGMVKANCGASMKPTQKSSKGK
jgi:hypothetical protein